METIHSVRLLVEAAIRLGLRAQVRESLRVLGATSLVELKPTSYKYLIRFIRNCVK